MATTTDNGALVFKRPNGSYLIVPATGSSTTALVYDPNLVPATFASSTAVPTKAVGRGAFAFKRPDGNFFVFLGNSSGTPLDTAGASSTKSYATSTNVYDPIANTFTDGPVLSGSVGGGRGALPIPLPNGQILIVHGKASNETSIYDSV